MPSMDEEGTRGQTRPDDADASGNSGWVTTDVAARAVRVSPRTIRRFIERGELKAKVEGEGVERRWLIDVDSLHALRASRPESASVPWVSGEEEEGAATATAFADVIREMAARVEERTAEAVEMRIRLELSEQAHSTVEEEARRLREEIERLRLELEALRGSRGAPETASEESYSTHAPPKQMTPVQQLPERVEEAMDRGVVPPEGQGQQHPVERPSWWRKFFGLE
jgi:Helix-turn-helix domain